MENTETLEAKPQRMTPAGMPNHRQEMKPLPLRVASAQYSRLCTARDRSGISIQEHIRRAIDIYLAQIEREAIELGLGAPSPPVQTQKTPSPASPKVRKR